MTDRDNQGDSAVTGNNIPRHIAIIMDGNGRWAKQRYLPRTAGHQAGVGSVRRTVEFCAEQGVQALTLFAFSSENWRRPRTEVSLLMSLFFSTLERETGKLHKNGIRVRFIGDRAALADGLQKKIIEAENLTRDNQGMNLVIAANYGGRWDMAQASRRVAEMVESGAIASSQVNEELIQAHLSCADLPEPDLFIRTGGDHRISNFLLWQLAYTELYFTPILWPDFDKQALQAALDSFSGRQRRFGYTGEQIEAGVTGDGSAH